MAEDRIDLRSVNWCQGMFLTPDHFLRQERYFDSLVLWLVRYGLNSAGLVGGGPRVDPAERGAARYDPVVEIDETADALNVSVVQCRGITGGGGVVEIDPSRPLVASFPKKELEGALDLGIYVVALPHEKEPDGSIEDPINPQIQAVRRYKYRLKLDVQADEADWALLLTRVRRTERGLRFERAMGFIPPCLYMSSHTALMETFRHLNEIIASLADRYGALHRAMVDFIALARTRGISTDQDVETLAFVSRMVVTLEECAYRLLDPLQAPASFFQEMNRLIRSAALFLSLSPPTREYFRLLAEIGEVEFVSMLEQEGEALQMGRRWSLHEDLSVEALRVRRALERLDRLEQALEGKYLDYRVSPSLESINFVFDRTSGDPVLFKSVSKPARPQAQGQELTFVFAPLRLEAREVYRVILVGDRQSTFMRGDRVQAELRVNPGEGYRHSPTYLGAEFEVEGQRNFALEFRAPDDVVTINDVRVSLRSSQPIRSAILYVRARLLVGTPAQAYAPPPAPRPAPPVQWSDTTPRPPNDSPGSAPGVRPVGRVRQDEPGQGPAGGPVDPDPPRPRRRIS